MDISSMLYFVTVCRYKNITKAAEALHISQPALSRRIMTLEEEVGAQLLDRKCGGFALTRSGTIFLEDAERIIKQQSHMMRKIDRYKHNDTIRVGYSSNLYLRPFVDVMCAFKAENPTKDVYFSENNIRKTVEYLLNDDLDIIYTSKGDIEGRPDIETVTVAENDMALLIPKGHKLWAKNSVTCESLAGETICTLSDGDQIALTASLTLEALKKQDAQFANIKDVVYCNSSIDLMLYVCSCGYIGLGGMLMASEVSMYPDRLKILKIDCDHIDYGDLVFAYKRENPVANDILQHIR